jgi:hypothetical protein
MDIHAFLTPHKTYRPMARWWWPGLDVEIDQLVREIGDLDESGLGGAELQPFLIGSPMDLEKSDPERAARLHRFMQPYHYEAMGAVLREAARRGLVIDITQNSAWPTGGTHITPEDSQQTLLFGETVLTGPRQFSGPVPPLKPLRLYFFFGKIVSKMVQGLNMLEYLPEDKKLVRVVAGRLLGPRGKFTSWNVKKSALLDPDSLVDLTDRVDASGRLEWQVPKGRWQLFAFYEGTAGAYPLMDARSAPGKNALVLNHFDRAAVCRHLDAFLWKGDGAEALRPYFGSTLRAIFTDSLELLSPMHWTQGFLEEFQRRRGYDLSPYLPAAYVPLKDVAYFTYNNEINLPNFDFPGEMGQRIRYDLQRTISDLFIDEFICAVASWAEEHGVRSRVQGYGMLADPLRMLGLSHIPETEQLYGGGALHFFKMAGSAASLYGRPVVTAETLIWAGRPYMTTPLKWRVALDRLFESGINQVIYHGFPYRHPGFPFPGFQPFSTPFTSFALRFSSDVSRNNPLLFESAPLLNGYAARAQYLLQESKTRAAVGIFYQLFDYPNGNIIQEELVQGVLDDLDAPLPQISPLAKVIAPALFQPATTGDRGWTAQCAALGSELVANGYYYQMFNEESLLRAKVVDGKVVMGEAEFEALVLYKETVLPVQAAEKLHDLVRAGIPVLFVGSLPERDPGFFEHETRDASVRQAITSMAARVLSGPDAVVDALRANGVIPQVLYEHPQKKIGFIHKTARRPGALHELFFLRSRSRKEQNITFQVKAGDLVPVELDLWSGSAVRLPFERSVDQILLRLTFPGYTARMIVLADAQFAESLPPAAPELREHDLQPVQVLTNFVLSANLRSADGATRSLEVSVDEPVDWRSMPELKGLGSPGTYHTHFHVKEIQPGQRFFLCFDQVCDRADITLNGQELPPVLVLPWRVEITQALHEGENELKVVVTPTLRNQLVEYGNRGAKLYKQYRKAATMPAGLIGPVRVCIVKE